MTNNQNQLSNSTILKNSKVNFTFNNEQNKNIESNASFNFNEFLGIKAAESRIKPVSVIMSPGYSEKRYSSEEKSQKVVSPIKINSP